MYHQIIPHFIPYIITQIYVTNSLGLSTIKCTYDTISKIHLFLASIFSYHILSMDKAAKMGTNVRAAEWALKRDSKGKSNISPYQVRNLKKAISLGSKSKKKSKRSKTKISAEDLAELKQVTKRAQDILNKYK